MNTDPVFQESLVFQTGCVGANGSIVFIILEEEKVEKKIPHAHLALYENNEWTKNNDFDFTCVRVVSLSINTWAVIGEAGEIVTFNESGITFSKRIYPQSKPGKMGVINNIKNW